MSVWDFDFFFHSSHQPAGAMDRWMGASGMCTVCMCVWLLVVGLVGCLGVGGSC